MPRVLLIDDSREFCDLLREDLAGHGYEVVPTESAEDAWPLLGEAGAGHFDVLLVDYRLRGQDGLGFLEDLRRQRVQIPAILITEHGTVDVVIEASRLGVLEFITKPVEMTGRPLDKLRRALDRGVETSRLMREAVRLPGDNRPAKAELIGSPDSGRMAEVYRLIGAVASDPCHQRPVLIVGETGTGKDLVARALFHSSARRGQPFLKVRCAAFDEKALDAELFGSWGDDRQQPGVFEKAHGGAVLLDDVGETSRCIQEKILQAIDEGIMCRPGRGTKVEVEVDVWVIACAHQRLESKFSHRFQRIELPPLRERGPKELDLLADHFLARAAADLRPCVRSFHEKAREKLRGHRWPGNITELQQEIRMAVHRCHDTQITAEDLRLDSASEVQGESTTHLRRAIEAALRSGEKGISPLLQKILDRELVRLTLIATSGSLEQMVEITGLPRAELSGLLQDGLGIPSPGGTSCEEGTPRKRLPPSREKAWRLYNWALQQNPAPAGRSYADVFWWLKKDLRVDGEDLPKNCDTFQKYVREARAFYDGSV